MCHLTAKAQLLFHFIVSVQELFISVPKYFVSLDCKRTTFVLLYSLKVGDFILVRFGGAKVFPAVVSLGNGAAFWLKKPSIWVVARFLRHLPKLSRFNPSVMTNTVSWTIRRVPLTPWIGKISPWMLWLVIKWYWFSDFLIHIFLLCCVFRWFHINFFQFSCTYTITLH